jgi:hypothetical protein
MGYGFCGFDGFAKVKLWCCNPIETNAKKNDRGGLRFDHMRKMMSLCFRERGKMGRKTEWKESEKMEKRRRVGGWVGGYG